MTLILGSSSLLTQANNANTMNQETQLYRLLQRIFKDCPGINANQLKYLACKIVEKYPTFDVSILYNNRSLILNLVTFNGNLESDSLVLPEGMAQLIKDSLMHNIVAEKLIVPINDFCTEPNCEVCAQPPSTKEYVKTLNNSLVNSSNNFPTCAEPDCVECSTAKVPVSPVKSNQPSKSTEPSTCADVGCKSCDAGVASGSNTIPDTFDVKPKSSDSILHSNHFHHDGCCAGNSIVNQAKPVNNHQHASTGRTQLYNKLTSSKLPFVTNAFKLPSRGLGLSFAVVSAFSLALYVASRTQTNKANNESVALMSTTN